MKEVGKKDAFLFTIFKHVVACLILVVISFFSCPEQLYIHIHIYIWTSPLLDRIGPVGRLGEKIFSLYKEPMSILIPVARHTKTECSPQIMSTLMVLFSENKILIHISL